MKKKHVTKVLTWLMTASMAGSMSGVTVWAAAPDAAIGAQAEGDAQEQHMAEKQTDPVGEENTGLPESDHKYVPNFDHTWTYTVEGATNGIYLTFDDQTSVENGYDFLYILDGDGNEVGKFTGTELAGRTIYVPTATVQIRLTSDRSGVDYGFKVSHAEACGTTIDLEKVGSVDAIAPVEVNETIDVTVFVNGKELIQGTDYKVAFDSSRVGAAKARITGMGNYSGVVESDFHVFDADNKLEGVSVTSQKSSLRQTGETGRASVSMEGMTGAYAKSIQSVTLEPIDQDGTVTDTKGKTYPNAPKTITLDKEDLTVEKNGTISFTRTAEDPVVYVMEGHEPIQISRWGKTTTYPQSQQYKVTVKAKGYKDVTGTTTYYTGTAPAFSIIVDADGNAKTTEDQETVKAWTSDELRLMAKFVNGSSQCGMTGFRTFSAQGVSLYDLLKQANVTVSENDSFLLDTSDHYGNTFTYKELFDTPRYFLDSIYEDGFAEKYNELVDNDKEAGEATALRRYLAEKCLENKTTLDPQICTAYTETLISGDSLTDAVLPTEENTTMNPLVAYENQFRFVYGIAVEEDACAVTFDSQGGSEVAEQLVKSHRMTSTDNTTIKSSYWANALVIYRGAGEKEEASEAAEVLAVPEAPVKDGYVFAGWYTDAACTDGHKFDFSANDGKADKDIKLYAKWMKADKTIAVTDFDITNIKHKDADAEKNQTIVATLTFSDDIKLTSDDLSEDLMIKIAGGDVNQTNRSVKYEVKNGNQLVITMISTDWAAIYNGMMSIQESPNGISHIVAADSDKNVVVTDQESRIPIGIVVNNDVKAGTTDAAASTYVSVAHKANMRGMYHYELVSIVNGEETVIGSSTSHAHNFYTTIDEAAIAGAMAGMINRYDGYSTTYTKGDTFFSVTADEAAEGETLVVRMIEDDAEANYAHAPSEVVIENRIEATADKDGSYDEVTYCSFCHKELSRRKVVIPATGSKEPQKPGSADDDQKNPGATTDDPQIPGSADTGDTNSQNTNYESDKETSGASPKTDDPHQAGLWALFVAAACAGGVVALKKRRVLKK